MGPSSQIGVTGTLKTLLESQLSQLCEVLVIPTDVAAELGVESECRTSASSLSSTQDDRMIPRSTTSVDVSKNSNLRSSDTGYEVLRAAIQQLNEDITYNDRNVLAVQLRINAMLLELRIMEETGKNQKDQRDRLQAMTSPVQLLPFEILTHVFSYRQDDETIPPSTPSLFVISQVCKLWRNACLGSASLWNTLSIKLTHDSHPRWWKGVLQLPLLWFKHAHNFPLSFSLRSCGRNDDDEFSSGIVTALTPFAHHLSDLQITVLNPNDLEPLLSLSPGSLPALKTLSLTSCRKPNRCVIRWRFRYFNAVLFGSAPNLREAYFDLYPMQINDQAQFAFPWSQLTSLQISQLLRPSAWYTIICQCVNLQCGTFTFSVDDDRSPFTPHPTPITYENLSSLDLRVQQYDDLDSSPHFDNLALPVLRDLSLNSLKGRVGIDTTLQQISTCSLQRLVLVRVTATLDHLIQFLSACTSVKELRIEFDPELEGLFEALRYGVEDIKPGPTMPNLVSFTACVFTGEDFFDGTPFDPVPIINLLRWWHQNNQLLKDVTLYLYGGESPSDDESIGPNSQADTLVSSLKDCIYDPVSCPEGFVFDVVTFDLKDIDYSSPLMNTPDGKLHRPLNALTTTLCP